MGRGRTAVLLASALLALGAVGCSGDDDAPSADDVPSGAVATIGGVEISSEDLDGQVDVLARAQRGGGGPKNVDGGPDPGTAEDTAAKQRRKQLEAQALSMLLMREALEQEGADRDIQVGDKEVRQRWDAAAKQQFKTKKALKRFLGGQRVADIIDQLRLQVLAERIHQQISEEAGGGKKGAKAVEEFQKDFQKRWQDKTACAEGYTAAGCNTPNPR